MAERLGEALLELGTDDSRLVKGLLDARRKAEQTMGDLAAAQARATTENAAAKAAYRAGEISLEAYNRRLIENKVALQAVQAQHASAQKSLSSFEQAGQQVVASAGQQRAGMQQLSFQLGDIATMYSLGARPAQIFASQIGQVTQAVQLMSGGTSRMAAFLGGPWGIALTAATIVLAPFVAKLFETEDALQSVDFASDNLGDAQGILGRVMDSTTLKMKEQTTTAIGLARALAAKQLVEAMGRQAEAQAAQRSISQGGLGDLRVTGTMGGLRVVRADRGKDLVDDYRAGRLTADQVEAQARARMSSGILSAKDYGELSKAVLDDVTAGANVKRSEDLLSALNGDTAAARRIFGATGGGSERGSRWSAGPRARSEGERAEDFSDRSLSIERQTLQARLQLATSADERAALQQQLLDLEREQRIAEVEASDLGAQRKAALIAQIEALLGTAPAIDEQGNLILSANKGIEGQIIERERLAQIEREAALLADTQFDIQRDALQLQLQLADTEAGRKAIALKLLEAEDAQLRARLEAVVASEIATEAEKQRAQIALDALNATAGTRRAGVDRQNETEMERYIRNLNATPGQINEALEGISIDGLETLNDGLTRAIMGAESLGQVFSRVADQIIADLLRIAIQQAIIKPLANALFGGGGGGDGGFLGSVFAGFFAAGGTIPTGQFGIVGEEGPELAFAGPGGLGILSNADSAKLLSGGGAGGTSVTIPITIDATGADAAAIARLNSRLDQLRAELPGTIVTTVRDAQDRRFLS